MKYLIALAIIVALPLANASIEKPRWSIGDYWVYAGNLKLTTSTGMENMSMSIDGNFLINMKIRIKDTTTIDIKGEKIPCYVADMNSSVEGNSKIEMKIPLIEEDKIYTIYVNADIETDATGEVYMGIRNLSIIKNDLKTNTHVKLDVDAPNVPDYILNMLQLSNKEMTLSNETQADYSPPLNFLDFPIERNEKWYVNSMVNYTIDNKYSGSQAVNFSFYCENLGDDYATIVSDYIPFLGEITVNIFGMNVPLLYLENTTFRWSNKTGMIEHVFNVQTHHDIMYDLTQYLDLQLIDYKYTPRSNKLPTVDISFTPLNPRSGTNIQFKAIASDEDGYIIAYEWDFGDGKKSYEQNPSHMYTKAGEYKVTLVVVDNYGDEAKATKTIIIESGGGGGTPGFESILGIAALLIIFLRRNLGSFK